MWLIPVVLLVSTIGGWFFARASLQPVDVITRSAQDITASNLSRRLPVRKSNDEIRRLTETLNDMISRLESSFEQIRQFTADASHELRTPLTLIRANAEVLLRHRDRIPRDDVGLVDDIVAETEHMDRLTTNLLTLARLDAGQLHLDYADIDLAEIGDLAPNLLIVAVERGDPPQFRFDEFGENVVSLFGENPEGHELSEYAGKGAEIVRAGYMAVLAEKCPLRQWNFGSFGMDASEPVLRYERVAPQA